MNDWYHNTIHTGLKSPINLGRSAVQAIVRAHTRRVAIRELSALDEHLLRDIGLHRSEIRSVVNGLLDSNASSPTTTSSHLRRDRLSPNSLLPQIET